MVSIEAGQNLAKGFGAPFFSTSARNRINVDEAVHELIRILRRKRAEASGEGKKKKKKEKPAKPVPKALPTSNIFLPSPPSTLVRVRQTFLISIPRSTNLKIRI